MTPLGVVEAAPPRPALPIGADGPPFEDLLGTDGRRYGFSSFGDRDVLVLIFGSNRCPTVKAHAERINAVQHDYGMRGVQLVAINSNDPHLYPDESFVHMVEQAATDGYAFPYLVDAGQAMARSYGATCTFHVFVLDAERRVRYQGRFDDSRIASNVTSHDLRNALDDILAGREVRTAITRPFGCSLDLV
jgi:hypothetical protein